MIPICHAEPLTLNIDGYVVSCSDNQAFYKKENNEWVKVSSKVDKWPYYLDDHFIGRMMCDVLICKKIEKPLIIDLVEYKEVGTKLAPEKSGFYDNSGSPAVATVYQTIPLKGEIRVELNYFSDHECKNKQLFSTVIKRL